MPDHPLGVVVTRAEQASIVDVAADSVALRDPLEAGIVIYMSVSDEDRSKTIAEIAASFEERFKVGHECAVGGFIIVFASATSVYEDRGAWKFEQRCRALIDIDIMDAQLVRCIRRRRRR